jgi:HK97 family phage major capsid protein
MSNDNHMLAIKRREMDDRVQREIFKMNQKQSPAIINAASNRALENSSAELVQFRSSTRDDLRQCKSNLEQYDLVSVLEGNPGRLEHKISEELQRVYGPSNGIRIPMALLARSDLAVGTNNIGGYLVDPNRVIGSLVPVLRPVSTAIRNGAVVLEGLVGSTSIPSQTSSTAPNWLSENTGVTLGAQDFTFGSIPLSPKRAVSTVGFSKQLLVQSRLAVTTVVARELVNAIAIAVDYSAFFGAGSASSQPLGITNQSGVSTVTFGSGAPTFANVLQFESALDSANVVDNDGTVKFVSSPSVRSVWKQTPRIPGSQFPSFLIEGDSTPLCNGYEFTASNQFVTGNRVVFGKFSDLIIGLWGSLDLVIDPYSQASANKTVVTSTLLVDVALQHPAAFCVSTNGGTGNGV